MFTKDISPKLNIVEKITRTYYRNRVFKKYSDDEIGELDSLRRVYSTSFPASDDGQENISHFFEYDNNNKNKKPSITSVEIERALLPAPASMNLTDITTECQSLATIIRVDLIERRQYLSGERLNSPAILFCAEFLAWLNNIAMQVISNDTLKQITSRISYLRAVLGKQVFFPEPNKDYEINKTIFFMCRVLEKKIIPLIYSSLSGQSLQDHFKQLKLHTETYFKHITNALFYLHTNIDNFEKFDITTLKETYKTKSAVRAATNTYLGQLFVRMVCDKTADGNHFLDNNGSISKELVLSSKKFKEKEKEYGIHPGLLELADKKDISFLLEKLIYVLGCIEDLRNFVSLFKQAYDLSSEVGNIGLSFFLGNEIDLLLYYFKQIMLKIENGLNYLLDKHGGFIEISIINANCQNWREHYFAFLRELAVADEHKTKFVDIIYEIRSLTAKVTSEEHLNEVRQKITDFKKNIAQLVTRCQIAATPGYTLIGNHGGLFSSTAPAITAEVVEDRIAELKSLTTSL